MIGKVIKELRTNMILSQAALAKEIGSYQKQISNWENEIIEPSISMLIALANFFDVSIDYLVGRE